MAILTALWGFRGLIGTAIVLVVLGAGIWRVVYVFDHYRQDEAVIATQKTTIKTLGDQIIDIGKVNADNLDAFNRQIAAFNATNKAANDRITSALAALDFAKQATQEADNAARNSPTCIAQPAISSAISSLRGHVAATARDRQPGDKPAPAANAAGAAKVR
jgi:hypothetical protein